MKNEIPTFTFGENKTRPMYIIRTPSVQLSISRVKRPNILLWSPSSLIVTGMSHLPVNSHMCGAFSFSCNNCQVISFMKLTKKGKFHKKVIKYQRLKYLADMESLNEEVRTYEHLVTVL